MPVPDASPAPIVEPTPDQDFSGVTFTGRERKQTFPDGRWILWQEYQFPNGGGRIWLDRDRGKDDNGISG